MYFKDFDSWNKLKKDINNYSHKISIREGEIRWILFGVNIGTEIDGKGNSFTRPGLILHVVGQNLALAVPLSTKLKPVTGYIPFEWKSKLASLCIHQMKIISQKRILSRKGKVSLGKLLKIKQEVKNFYSL